MAADAEDTPISTRLCVKGLPKYVNEKRLKEHFAAKGAVTDVKILRTKCVSVLLF
jgi:multiple RNA-binding domain-containing protein 1